MEMFSTVRIPVILRYITGKIQHNLIPLGSWERRSWFAEETPGFRNSGLTPDMDL
jgi:hypothetical protein